uniref:Uncharacterized protein n=1 Tax=Anguilla anguilla TaxID=7936 RepID=A0A0E9UA81_ANGAN
MLMQHNLWNNVSRTRSTYILSMLYFLSLCADCE